MSPLALRRYRAERLLRSEFEGVRSKVLSIVAGKLGGAGVKLDRGDLEACYSQAWQGLYAAILEGEEVANITGWLVLVTFRRAIDEHRSHGRDGEGLGRESDAAQALAQERDIAAELDDRARLRQLLEGLRGRLSQRESQAAALCYLQGLSRAEAAAQMGISEARMRKLMEGRGAGSPGVAGKVGELLKTIAEGGWCEEQASLMRGLAFGVLDPKGERYRLAVLHRRECPACRRYVLSLRGLAATLPPIALPWPHGVACGPRGSGSARFSRASTLRPRAGTGAHGGSLLGGGSLAGKLAVTGLVVLGAGTGTAALLVGGARSEPHRIGSGRVPSSVGGGGAVHQGGGSLPSTTRARTRARTRTGVSQRDHRERSATSASREFGLERGSEASPRASAGVSAATQPAPGRGASGTAGERAQREFGIE